MIVCRPYIQTSLFNLLMGIEIPIVSLILLIEVLLNPVSTHKVEYFLLFPLLILAGLYLTRLFNLLVGIGLPVLCLFPLIEALHQPVAAHRVYYFILLPFFLGAGIYFLIERCVWSLQCDEEKRTITFVQFSRRRTFLIREMKELIVFNTLRGYDYCFKTSRFSFNFEEMDNMHELIAFLKRINPQIDITSPEDHKYF